MKIRGNITMLVVIAAFLAAAVFAGLRFREIRIIDAKLQELNRKADQLSKTAAETERLKKQFPTKADISSFVENMSVLALRSGIRELEITTPSTTPRTTPAAKPKSGAPSPPHLTTYPIKLTFEGNFRAVAEFLRQVQSTDQYKRIVQIDMKPSTNTIKTILVIEISSFEDSNAA